MICKKCNTEKQSSEFYSSDKTCKECRRAAVKANRIAKSDYYKEYEKGRANNPKRVAARKAYAKTEAGKEARKRAQKRWLEKNPIKRAVHIITGNAIRDGALKKKPCEVCGNVTVHAHHDDYAMPLKVRWLCEKHHYEWHQENGEGLNAN